MSEAQTDIIRLALEALRYDLRSTEEADAAESVMQVTLGSEEASRVEAAVLAGNWPLALEFLYSVTVPEYLDAAIFNIEVQQVYEMLQSRKSPMTVVKYVRDNIKPEHARLLGILPLTNQTHYLGREALFSRLKRAFKPEFSVPKGELQHILDDALKLRQLFEDGAVTAVRADARGFVNQVLYIEQDGDAIARLKALCRHAGDFNQFCLSSVTDRLTQLIRDAIAIDEYAVVNIIRSSPDFMKTLRRYVEWSPLYPPKPVAGFDYIYECHRRGIEATSVVDLAKIARKALDKTSTVLDLDDTNEQGGFTLIREITGNSPFWVVSFSTSAQYLAASQEDGTFVVYEMTNMSITTSLKFRKPVIGIRWHPTLPKLLAFSSNGECRTLEIETREWYALDEYWDTDEGVFGDMCWHPSDTELVYVGINTELSLRTIAGETVWAQEIPPGIQAIAPLNDEEVLILSTKVADEPQRLAVARPDSIDQYVLPMLENDGQFTSLRVSRWDPRTILLVGPPNCVYIIDRLGERPVRVLYGPKQSEYMIRAEFAGPLDKFILSGSEEPEAFVFNRFTGNLVTLFTDHEKMVNTIAWGQNTVGTFIATGGDDERLFIYKKSTVKPERSALKSP